MSVGLILKCYEGIVIAADSATTIVSSGNLKWSYIGASKIASLHLNPPVACLGLGCASFGSLTFDELITDFSGALSDKEIKLKYAKRNTNNYVYSISHQLQTYLDEVIISLDRSKIHSNMMTTSIIIVGYNRDSKQSEVWSIICDGSHNNKPQLIADESTFGILPFGSCNNIKRIVFGFDDQLTADLIASFKRTKGLPEALKFWAFMQHQLIFQPGMPVQAAIELAKFLVTAEATCSRYRPIPQVVGLPVKIVTLSHLQGLNWVEN